VTQNSILSAGLQQWHRGYDISYRQAGHRLQTIPTNSITQRDRQIGRRQRHGPGKGPTVDPEAAREERPLAAGSPRKADSGVHAQERQDPGGGAQVSAQHPQRVMRDRVAPPERLIVVFRQTRRPLVDHKSVHPRHRQAAVGSHVDSEGHSLQHPGRSVQACRGEAEDRLAETQHRAAGQVAGAVRQV
jgi:hypothetical protein